MAPNKDSEAGETVIDEAAIDEAVSGMKQAVNDDKESSLDKVDNDSAEAKAPEQGESEQASEETQEEAETPPQTTEDEKKAIEQGWKPKDQFEGDPADWVSAREFNKNGDFIDVIKNQSKKIKKLEEGIQKVVEINEKMQKYKVDERAAEILQAKREAITNGNIEEVEKLEKILDEVRKEALPDKPVAVQAARDFEARNRHWFNDSTPENIAMKNYALAKEIEVHNAHPDWSDEQNILEVEKATKKYFNIDGVNTNINRTRPAAVNITPPENVSLGKAKKKFTFSMVPQDSKQMVRTIADACGMTLDDYANQLHEQGEF